MDHALVKRLRGEVGDRLAGRRRLDAAAGMTPMTLNLWAQVQAPPPAVALSSNAHPVPAR